MKPNRKLAMISIMAQLAIAEPSPTFVVRYRKAGRVKAKRSCQYIMFDCSRETMMLGKRIKQVRERYRESYERVSYRCRNCTWVITVYTIGEISTEITRCSLLA